MINAASAQQRVIIITGPTAAGKTALSYDIARELPCEIINADVGQFYKPLSVGTAKPDWQAHDCPAHLFDIIDTPRDISVTEYRTQVLALVDAIIKRGKTPIIVGGSLFYIKSLFYVPQQIGDQSSRGQLDAQLTSWDALYAIDPDRAMQIHKNDTYRISRALTIWRNSGCKPSLLKPVFDMPFDATIISLEPSLDILTPTLKQRVIQMMPGWQQEVRELDAAWYPFLETKNIIGYPLIIKLLASEMTENEVVDRIVIQTRQYAKRQYTFLKKMLQQINQSSECDSSKIISLSYDSYGSAASDILSLLEKSLV